MSPENKRSGLKQLCRHLAEGMRDQFRHVFAHFIKMCRVFLLSVGCCLILRSLCQASICRCCCWVLRIINCGYLNTGKFVWRLQSLPLKCRISPHLHNPDEDYLALPIPNCLRRTTSLILWRADWYYIDSFQAAEESKNLFTFKTLQTDQLNRAIKGNEKRSIIGLQLRKDLWTASLGSCVRFCWWWEAEQQLFVWMRRVKIPIIFTIAPLRIIICSSFCCQRLRGCKNLILLHCLFGFFKV